MTYFFKMRSALLALVLMGAGTVLPQTAVAQTPTDPEVIKMMNDPAALKIANEILEVSRVTSGYNNILPEMAERTKQTFTRTAPQLATLISEVTDTVAVGLISKRVELQQEAAKLWTMRFSKEELEEILEFYNSPVGVKFALNYPPILRDSVELTNDWGNELAQELAAKVRVEMGLRGHKL
ncbi:DUF2059 domain-containing protein [Pararhizobium sp. IMCC21322]|uniref:DUF2059 domain-containing protein n=1 Tax=Pararhizobium sp. IMCC21322 TaxID=3067903 RepID=UPI002740B292|nr:DUF2059 domain-containing protein [Pararhizobium sp. IMCC21322]